MTEEIMVLISTVVMILMLLNPNTPKAAMVPLAIMVVVGLLSSIHITWEWLKNLFAKRK